MRRLGMALVLAVALVAFAAPAASAGPPPAGPSHGAYEGSGTLPDAGLGCAGGPVEWGIEVSYRYVDFFLKDGTVREVGHQVEQDTFSANGKTLVGNPSVNNYIAVLSDVDWTTIYSMVGSGHYLSVTLPDGTLIQISGRIDWLERMPVAWTPDNGHSGDLAAICACFFG